MAVTRIDEAVDREWFRQNPRKRVRHRAGRRGEVIHGVSMVGGTVCVVNAGGALTWHICDGRGPLITEAGPPTCRRRGCHGRNHDCPR